MADYSLDLPAELDEDAVLIEDKGWFDGVTIHLSGKRYRIHFYDAVRFAQDVRSSIDTSGWFLEKNAIVIRAVSKANMLQALERIVRSGMIEHLVPENRTEM